ncbi:MAG: hypothetical protein RDU30_01775 [Desulfovibrionaceae bacterium]|nr:hypothetical protein [Desulfovibrionaceae bacterium]
MKRIPIATLLLLTAWTCPALAEVYACLDPNGAVICHVADSEGKAASLCNAQCPACRNACTASQLVSGRGDARLRITGDPRADKSPNMVAPGADNRETARTIIEDGLVETPQ